jgi:TfoX/Sxy family transcriptional regulator of competence genes
MEESDIEDRLLAQLTVLGEISSRPLFGGRGPYRDETIFGILFLDRLYL